jgi:hypothetical protein
VRKNLLGQNRDVLKVPRYSKLGPEQLPDKWFTATEVPLGVGAEKYLVVMAAEIVRGANINSFWVFRESDKGCGLLFQAGAHDLENRKTSQHQDRRLQRSELFRALQPAVLEYNPTRCRKTDMGNRFLDSLGAGV